MRSSPSFQAQARPLLVGDSWDLFLSRQHAERKEESREASGDPGAKKRQKKSAVPGHSSFSKA